MKPDEETIAKTIDAVNRRFYQAHHSAFNTTRQFGWPGWQSVMATIKQGPKTILDIGCGNGRFARFLDGENNPLPPPDNYLGLDPNAQLLSYAAKLDVSFTTRWKSWSWFEGSTFQDGQAAPFELVVVFGVLHHIYGRRRRAAFIRWCGQQVAPGGHLVISAWDFGRHKRFVDKTASPKTIYERTGLNIAQLEPNDHFLGFGSNASPLRYCHWIDDGETLEIMDMMQQTSAKNWVHRDLEDKSDLNRYWIWQLRP